MKKELILMISALFLISILGFASAVPAPCSNEEQYNCSNYGIEGFIREISCGETFEDQPCIGGPINILQRCIATIEITKVLKGDYEVGNEIEIAFKKMYERNDMGCTPGSFVEGFIEGHKIRYYDSSLTCIWNRLTKLGVISNTGKIKYLDLEGGCWIIETEDEIQYGPINLEEEYKQEGLEIEFEAVIKTDYASICQVGTLIELTDIEIITEENETGGEVQNITPGWVKKQMQEGTIGIKNQNTHQFKERLQFYLNATECAENCTCAGSTVKCWLNGQRQMTVVAGNSGNIIIQVKGINASTNVTLYKEDGKIYGEFGNETRRIHDPEQIKEKIRKRIRAKLEGYNITLDEDGYYRVQTKKKARLFLIVPVREKVKAQVNAETGEIIKVRNPWWGFLARDTREEPLLGADCGTVSPEYVDECCQNKGYDFWDSEEFECAFSE